MPTLTPGGGGNGAMPTLPLSLAAAAAAADAYLRPSPAGLAGAAAGFIDGFTAVLLLIADKGVCSVARAGKGDFVWDEAFRAGASISFVTFLEGFDGKSGSGVGSSCTDWPS